MDQSHSLTLYQDIPRWVQISINNQELQFSPSSCFDAGPVRFGGLIVVLFGTDTISFCFLIERRMDGLMVEAIQELHRGYGWGKLGLGWLLQA